MERTRLLLAKIALVAVALLLSAGCAMGQGTDSEIDRALVCPDFTWRSLAEGGARVYYQPGSFAERHRVMLLRSAQAAMATGLAFLDMKADTKQVRVIYVNDRAEMEKLVGRTYSGYADWTGQGVFVVCNPGWRSFDTHEIAHLLTMGRWGRPIERSAWMIEGIPMAVDGYCQTADVERIASYLLAAGRWPGLSAFTANPSAIGEIPRAVFAGSLVRYLRARHGAQILEETWRSGLEAALSARKTDLSRLEAGWLDSLRSLGSPLTEEEWQKLEAGGCG